MVKEYIPKNVEADDLINQTKGLKLVKERKRQEKTMINRNKFDCTIVKTNARKHGKSTKYVIQIKRQKLSDQIQRGFDIATKWRHEDVDKLIE